MTQEQLKEVLHKKIADAGIKDCANKVAEMIFHPNGNLNGSWVDNEDVLLQYKR